MSYRVINKALRITIYQSPLKSFHILLRISKFSFLMICAAWFLNDKVWSFHQGVHLCTLSAQKQSSKHSSEAAEQFQVKGQLSSTYEPRISASPTLCTIILKHIIYGTLQRLLQDVLSVSCYKVESVPCTQFSVVTGSTTNFATKLNSSLSSLGSDDVTNQTKELYSVLKFTSGKATYTWRTFRFSNSSHRK